MVVAINTQHCLGSGLGVDKHLTMFCCCYAAKVATELHPLETTVLGVLTSLCVLTNGSVLIWARSTGWHCALYLLHIKV